MQNYIDLDKYNSDVGGVGRLMLDEMKGRIQSLSSSQRKRLYRSLRLSTGKKDGMINRISFKMQRSGIFLEKGAGRGYKMLGGYPTRINGGTSKRIPKPWFNPSVEQHESQLADIAAKHYADIAMERLKI